MSTFQNGGTSLSQRFATTERLDVQNRLDGCIFLCSTPQGFKKIYSVSVGMELMRVRLSIFWTRSCPQIFTKLLKVPIAILCRLKIRIILY